MEGNSCPLANGGVGEEDLRYLYQQQNNWGGVPLLSPNAFSFSTSERSQILITCWVNREGFEKSPNSTSCPNLQRKRWRASA